MTKNEKEVIQHVRDCLEVYMSVVDKAIDTNLKTLRRFGFEKQIPVEVLNAMANEMSANVAELEKIIK
jgi:hypothetical protein